MCFFRSITLTQIENVQHKRSNHDYEKNCQVSARACLHFSDIPKPQIVKNPTEIVTNTVDNHHIREKALREIKA